MRNLKCNQLINDIRKDHYTHNILYTIMGGLLGALGLLYNSNPVILGSMLVSPLGSPLFGAISGIITKESKYMLSGVSNFILLATICIIIGMIIGFVNDIYLLFKTPTSEMKKRVTTKHMIINILIALISGVTLAFAKLNRDFVVIAGINLTVSILPPLVNAGLYYGKYLINKVTDKDKLLRSGTTSLILALANIIGIIITAYITLRIIC